MASELCMNCFSVKGSHTKCPFCGYIEGTPPQQPHYLTPGTILGNRFIVGTVMGVGGFGITYKAFDYTLGVIVAVKEFYPVGLVNRAPGECRVGILPGDKARQYKERLDRFLVEAQSVAQFGSARDIVNVFDFFEENDTAYIIMENIKGNLLKDYLDTQGAIPPETAMNIIMLIIEAVKKIHSKGILHRDISPDNIFITEDDEIKIFDFGAARLNDSKEGMAAEPVIKVGYSPLEQYRDNSKQGFYTDVYAVGAILYQMLTGVKPIESTEREVKDELKSPLELGIEINPNTDRAVMEALSVRPELRFQGIQQLQDALQNKRIAEYPKEKIRKRRRTRYWTVSLSILAALAVVVVIGLYSTVLKPHNQIFDTQVKAGTQITIWVENEDQKSQIEALAENGFKKGDSDTEDERVRKMQEENESVAVNVLVQDDMEAALEGAMENDSVPLPNMFLTDHVTNLDDYKLVSLKENVYDSLDTEKYYFLSEFENTYGNMKELPTGIDTLLLYACQFDYHKNNTLNDSSFAKNVEGYGIELSELMDKEEQESVKKKDGEKEEETRAVVCRDSITNVLLLEQNKDWKKVFLRDVLPDQNMIKSLSTIQTFSLKKSKQKYQINTGQKNEIYWSNIIAGVGYRSRMNAEIDWTEDKGANPISGYKTYVVTQDDKMLVEFSERYAITSESDKDQQTACMRMLWVILSEIGQAKKVGPGQTTYPILRSEFEEFPSYNANFEGFVQFVKDYRQCILVGRENRDAQNFAAGLGTNKTKKEIKLYCEKYVSNEEEDKKGSGRDDKDL